MTEDDLLEEHMQRFHKPDGNCLHCQRPANRYHPVGRSRSQNLNLTTAIKSGRMSFAVGNASLIGSPSRPEACSLPTSTERKRATSANRRTLIGVGGGREPNEQSNEPTAKGHRKRCDAHFVDRAVAVEATDYLNELFLAITEKRT